MALQRAVRSDTFEKFKFERKGDTVKGYYIQTTEVTIDGRQVKKHIFKTDKGVVSVLGQADMYQQLKDNNCERAYVEVTFTGASKKLKGGRTMKLYDVDFDLNNKWEGDVAEVEEESTEEAFEEESFEEEPTLDADEPAVDEAPPARAKAPATPTPKASLSATQRLLAGNKRTA